MKQSSPEISSIIESLTWGETPPSVMKQEKAILKERLGKDIDVFPQMLELQVTDTEKGEKLATAFGQAVDLIIKVHDLPKNILFTSSYKELGHPDKKVILFGFQNADEDTKYRLLDAAQQVVEFTSNGLTDSSQEESN